MLTLAQAKQILESLQESITDPGIDFGPAYGLACERHKDAIALMKRIVKELK